MTSDDEQRPVQRRAQRDVTVPLAEAGDSAADGQLGTAHCGVARARGRAALFLQVMAIAAVSALLTVLGAGNLSVRIEFGDRLSFLARPLLELSDEGRVAGQIPRKDALHDFAELAEAQSYLLHMRLICKKRNANGRSARRKIEN